MKKVFVGGSRRINRLNADVHSRLDRIIKGRLPVIVGDANGADKAVQSYLRNKNYDLVEVFCAGGDCRNNIGGWRTRNVAAEKLRGSDFYAAKDRAMASEGSHGLMIWDGKSVGTLMNVLRLVEQDKIVVVYVTPTRKFVDIKSESDLQRFLDDHAYQLKADLADRARRELKSFVEHPHPSLL
jgi:hypothetical protein